MVEVTALKKTIFIAALIGVFLFLETVNESRISSEIPRRRNLETVHEFSKSLKLPFDQMKKKKIEVKTSDAQCHLCRDRWLFILGTGRSGSTTILEMMNSLPGVKLSGENGGALLSLFDLPFFPGNKKRVFFSFNKTEDGAFEHGTVRKNEIYCWIQKYFKLISGEEYYGKKVRINGFKSIRLFQKKHLEFLKEIFPCAKFVINYRENIWEQRSSRFRQEDSYDEIYRLNEQLREFAETYPKDTYIIPLEQFSVKIFNEIAAWIGYKDCQFSSVVHANSNKGHNSDYNTSLKGSCTL